MRRMVKRDGLHRGWFIRHLENGSARREYVSGIYQLGEGGEGGKEEGILKQPERNLSIPCSFIAVGLTKASQMDTPTTMQINETT